MGLEFIDQGEVPAGYVGGATFGSYGRTDPPKLELVGISLTKTADGVQARVKDFNYTTKSHIIYRADFYKDGQRVIFNREQKNIDRTSKHEAEHRDKQHQEYNRIHDQVVKDLNSGQTYKDSKAAVDALGKKLNDAFRDFNNRDKNHMEPVWRNYKPLQQLERPPDASAAEKVGQAETGLNPKPK
jgi:hypothetical protein